MPTVLDRVNGPEKKRDLVRPKYRVLPRVYLPCACACAMEIYADGDDASTTVALRSSPAKIGLQVPRKVRHPRCPQLAARRLPIARHTLPLPAPGHADDARGRRMLSHSYSNSACRFFAARSLSHRSSQKAKGSRSKQIDRGPNRSTGSLRLHLRGQYWLPLHPAPHRRTPLAP